MKNIPQSIATLDKPKARTRLARAHEHPKPRRADSDRNACVSCRERQRQIPYFPRTCAFCPKNINVFGDPLENIPQSAESSDKRSAHELCASKRHSRKTGKMRSIFPSAPAQMGSLKNAKHFLGRAERLNAATHPNNSFALSMARFSTTSTHWHPP